MEGEEEERKGLVKRRTKKRLRRSLIYMAKWANLHHRIFASMHVFTQSPWGVCQSAGLTFSASLAFCFTPEARYYPPPKRVYRKLARAFGRTLGDEAGWNRHARAFLAGEEAKTKQFQTMTLPQKVSLIKEVLDLRGPFAIPERPVPKDEAERFRSFYSAVMCSTNMRRWLHPLRNLISMRLISDSSRGEGTPTLEMFLAQEKVDEWEARELLDRYRRWWPFAFSPGEVKVVAIGTVPLHHFLPPVRISAQNRRGTLGGIVRSADGFCYGVTAHHVAFPLEDEASTPEVGGEERPEEASTRQDKMTVEGEEGKGEEEEGEHEDSDDEEEDMNVDIECDLVEVRAQHSTPADGDTAFPFTLLTAPAVGLQTRFLGYGVSLPLLKDRDVALVELDDDLAFTVGALRQPVGSFTLFSELGDMQQLQGREVSKYGCRTGHTQGVIEHEDIIGGVAVIVPAEPHQAFAQEGDSGSLCITARGELVGVISRRVPMDDRVIVRLLAQEDLEGLA